MPAIQQLHSKLAYLAPPKWVMGVYIIYQTRIIYITYIDKCDCLRSTILVGCWWLAGCRHCKVYSPHQHTYIYVCIYKCRWERWLITTLSFHSFKHNSNEILWFSYLVFFFFSFLPRFYYNFLSIIFYLFIDIQTIEKKIVFIILRVELKSETNA